MKSDHACPFCGQNPYEYADVGIVALDTYYVM